MLVNKSTLSKVFGVSTNTVGKWMSSGCPHEKDGRDVEFETVEVMAWMYGEQPNLSVMKNRLTQGLEDEGEEKLLNPEQEKARADKERADKIALENQLRREELMEVSDAMEAWTKTLMEVRAGFLSLPSNVSEELAPMTSARQVKHRLTAEVSEILEALSSEASE